jgi:hypothetical protein
MERSCSVRFPGFNERSRAQLSPVRTLPTNCRGWPAMPLISASVDVFLSTALVLIGSYLYFTRFFLSKTNSSSQPHRPPLRTQLNILLLLHTLYILHALILKYPPNIFQSLYIPLTTPTEQIRTLLLRASNGEPLNDTLENLLTRLGSYEVRTLYVRCASVFLRSPFTALDGLRSDSVTKQYPLALIVRRILNTPSLRFQRRSCNTFAPPLLLDSSLFVARTKSDGGPRVSRSSFLQQSVKDGGLALWSSGRAKVGQRRKVDRVLLWFVKRSFMC